MLQPRRTEKSEPNLLGVDTPEQEVNDGLQRLVTEHTLVAVLKMVPP
jgi:hypothetical protein